MIDHLHVPMRPVPGGRWGLVWLCTLAIVGASVVGLEMLVRSRGFVPSVKDDEYLWAIERDRVADNSPRTMAILGASRILLAFSPKSFREELPGWKYVMLAKQGSQPLASLRDLAFEPSFQGIALVDIAENGFAYANWSSQDDLVDTYHKGWRTVGQLAERRLETEVQSRVALLATDGMRTLNALSAGSLPTPAYTTTFADRTRYADYALTDVDRKRAVQLARMEGPAEEAYAQGWLGEALMQELYIWLIQSRGGQVVYVRMPTCDERWSVDMVRYPRERFWDALARTSRAVTIHFKDYPALSSFECPDTSHIASKDGPAFTRGLIDVLRSRGVVK